MLSKALLTEQKAAMTAQRDKLQADIKLAEQVIANCQRDLHFTYGALQILDVLEAAADKPAAPPELPGLSDSVSQ